MKINGDPNSRTIRLRVLACELDMSQALRGNGSLNEAHFPGKFATVTGKPVTPCVGLMRTSVGVFADSRHRSFPVPVTTPVPLDVDTVQDPACPMRTAASRGRGLRRAKMNVRASIAKIYFPARARRSRAR